VKCFIVLARHHKTKELVAWTVQRPNLWTAIRDARVGRGIDVPSNIEQDFLDECAIVVMEPGAIHSDDTWAKIWNLNAVKGAMPLPTVTELRPDGSDTSAP